MVLVKTLWQLNNLIGWNLCWWGGIINKCWIFRVSIRVDVLPRCRARSFRLRVECGSRKSIIVGDGFPLQHGALVPKLSQMGTRDDLRFPEIPNFPPADVLLAGELRTAPGTQK